MSLRNAGRALCACVAFLFVPCAAALAQTQPQPSALEIYSQALKAMSNLPQPPYVTYRLESKNEGLQVMLTTVHHLVWLYIEAGSSPSEWDMRHRTDDYASEIVNTIDGRRYVTQRSFFDPTWYGSYRALRDGMFYYQDVERPISARTVTPAPASNLKTIAVVSVMGPGIYNIEDRGNAACSNGDPGRALHLWPRSRDRRRQLTDVIVDMRSMRFCMIRYGLPNAFGFHGLFEQHYADVDGYWMQTDGFIDGTLRAFGISTHHGVWRYRLTGMQFPKALSASAFIPDANQ